MIRKLGSISVKLVHGSVCCNLRTESAQTRQNYVILWTNDVNSGDSETERPRCFWIEMILPGNRLLAVKNDSMTLKQKDCAPNNCWYGYNINVNRVSMIFSFDFFGNQSVA